MNKKTIVGLIVILAIITVAIIFAILPYIQNNKENSGNNILNFNEKNSLWTISINGKNITLPCKLSELTKTGLKIYSEYDYERIINSQNETFSMIYAVSEGWKEGVYLKIVTGDNLAKKEENATVTVITNMVTTDMYGRFDMSDNTTKEQFHLKDGVAIGSSKEQVLNAFGNNYVQAGDETMGIWDTLIWQIVYKEESNSVMFYFKNGVVHIIEVRNEE